MYTPVASLKHGRPLAIDYTNPSSSVSINAGDGVLIASGHVGFAVGDIGPSAAGSLYVGPAVFTVTKDTSTFAVGAAVYWDNTNKCATSTSTSNTLIGYAESAAGSGDATVDVVLTLK